jgi:hypothetical protein
VLSSEASKQPEADTDRRIVLRSVEYLSAHIRFSFSFCPLGSKRNSTGDDFRMSSVPLTTDFPLSSISLQNRVWRSA